MLDIFGFKKQGVNYEKYRPDYPQEFFDEVFKASAHKNKHLDVACGTGKVLFPISTQFKESKAIDLSQVMLDAAKLHLKDHLNTHPDAKISINYGDVNSLEASEKFDLVTVGQALHFFKIEEFMKKVKTILNQDGLFVVFGYILKGTQSQNPQENEYFNEFYSKIKPYFTFNMDQLLYRYNDQKKYPFESVFDKVERVGCQVKIKMRKEQLMGYLMTMSGYNLFVEDQKVDPIETYSAQCAQEVTCVFDYFKITSSMIKQN